MADKRGKIFFDLKINDAEAKASLQRFTENVSAVKSKILGVAGAIGIAFSFKTAINEALEMRNTVVRLSETLLKLGVYHKDVVNKMLKEQSELQFKFAVSDETIREMYNLFLRFGVPVNMVNELTKAVGDMAKVLKMDFEEAAFVTAKSLSGSINLLRRYGVEWEKTGNVVQDTLNIISALQLRFANTSGEVFENTKKNLERLKLAFNDFLESLGDRFLDIIDTITFNLVPTVKVDKWWKYYRQIIEENLQGVRVEAQKTAEAQYKSLNKEQLQQKLKEIQPVFNEWKTYYLQLQTDLRNKIQSLVEDKEDWVLRGKESEEMITKPYIEELKTYAQLKGQIDALNELLNERIKNEDELNKKLKEQAKAEEERFAKLIKGIKDEFEYKRATRELTLKEIEAKKGLLLVEEKLAKRKGDYSRLVEIQKLKNELRELESFVKEIEKISKEVRPIELTRRFSEANGELKQLQVDYKTIVEDITKEIEDPFQKVYEEFLYAEKLFLAKLGLDLTQVNYLTVELNRGLAQTFTATFNYIGEHISQTFRKVFGEANSLLEVLLENVFQVLAMAGIKFGITAFLQHIGLTALLPFIYHQGGIVKAHSGIYSREDIPVIAKKGEMILNDRQQTILWNMLNYGASNKHLQQTLIINLDGKKIGEEVLYTHLPNVMNKLKSARVI